jgi:hypothetical protein
VEVVRGKRGPCPACQAAGTLHAPRIASAAGWATAKSGQNEKAFWYA